MKDRLLIVPGWQDSEPEHWQSIWQKKFNCQRLVQDEWMNPDRSKWTHRLAESVNNQSEPPILIAHSMGCNTAAIVSAERDCNILGAFLVAPVDLDMPKTPPEIKSFLPTPASKLRFPSVVIASEDDPYCPIDQAKKMAEFWGSKFVSIGHQGHINLAAGFGEWTEGEKLLNEFLSSINGQANVSS